MKKVRYSIISIIVTMGLCATLAACSSKNESKKTETVAAQTSEVIASNAKKIDYFVLVNKQNKLPDDWEDTVELAEAKGIEDETIYVEKKALEQFYKLQNELLKEGIDIRLESTYRSVKEQQEIWDDWTVEYGEEYVKTYVAVPGFSEHHTGLAIDVCLVIDGKIVNDNDEMIAQRDIFAKVHAKLAKYGFILRYLEGKEDITGYGYEPWHFRYINDPEVAGAIMSEGITLEEYLRK